MGLFSGGGGGGLQRATKTLTTAQVRALPTTGVDVLAAQGAGTVIVPIHATLHLAWVADFANINSAAALGIQFGTTLGLSVIGDVAFDVAGLLANGEDGTAWLPQLARVVATGQRTDGESGMLNGDVANLPATLVGSNSSAGNYTLGTGSVLTVTMLYYVVTF